MWRGRARRVGAGGGGHVLGRGRQRRGHGDRGRHPAEAQTSHAPLARPESNTEPSYKAANNRHLVQNSSSKKVLRRDDKEEGDEEERDKGIQGGGHVVGDGGNFKGC